MSEHHTTPIGMWYIACDERAVGYEPEQETDEESTFGGLERVMTQDGTVFWTSKHNARLMDDGLFINASDQGAEHELAGKVCELEHKLRASEHTVAQMRGSLASACTRPPSGLHHDGSLKERTASTQVTVIEFGVIKVGRGLVPKLRRKLAVVGVQQHARLINKDVNGRAKKEFLVSQLLALTQRREQAVSGLRIAFSAESRQKEYEVEFECGEERARFCKLLLTHSSAITCDPCLLSADTGMP